MFEKLEQALDHISLRHIEEAVRLPAVKKRRRYFRMGLAAVLALVLISRIGFIPLAVPANAVALSEGSRVEERPDRDDYPDYDTYKPISDAWWEARDQRYADADAALQAALPFFAEGSAKFLSGTENKIWSPANAYIGLAMLAEVTGGETSQQLMQLLGADSVEVLRTRVGALWETTYLDNGHELCLLANSLWLDEDVDYVQSAMENLAYYHYADVYQGNFGTARTDRAMQTWLNNNTGGMLDSQSGSLSLPEDTLLALASTIYFQAKWGDEFSALNNTKAVFHAVSGDVTATFMNKKLAEMNYYWGDSYGAVALSLKNGSQMWFILPDEDKTLEEVLAEGQYLDMIADTENNWAENRKYMKVNLSVPKFDVSSSADLSGGLKEMGVTDVFTLGEADFSPALTTEKVYVSAVNQAVRVQIDEKGVKAAAYIEIPGAGAAEPPTEIMDFILDRPFLFVVTRNSIPLFAGVVNEP